MNKQIKITLKSDLCVASGDGYSMLIDTDVVFDKNGIPFIPARRIKGCLRDAATQIELILGENAIDNIFGKTGSSEPGSLSVENAVVENFDKVLEKVKVFGKKKTADMFSYTRAQTAIENGVAKDNSLRFTRVVCHYKPREISDSKEEMVFAANISVDEKYVADLEKICKALKNIGYNRNRGIGAIKCELIQANSDKKENISAAIDDEKEYSLNYKIKLVTDIMLPGNSADETEEYISGTSVLGFFAGKLKTLPEEEFSELFIQNKVRFSNLYPYSEDGGKCIPSPMIVGKDKTAEEGKQYKCTVSAEKDKIYKPVKGSFVDENFWPYEVSKSIVYHHSKGDAPVLYTQECLSQGQEYYGTISGNGKLLKKIINQLNLTGKMSFGRSKTAQYSVCELSEQPEISETTIKMVDVKSEEKYVWILESDVIIPGEKAEYCPTFEQLKTVLGLDEKAKILPETAIDYKTVKGYNAKWNQKKPHIRAIKAGSVVVFEGVSGEISSIKYIGEKQGEGFGKVVLMNVSDINPQNMKKAKEDKKETCSPKEEKRQKCIDFAEKNTTKLKALTSSFVGRLTLMLEEAGSYDNFVARINSIKGERKDNALKIIKDFEKKMEIEADFPWSDYQEYLLIVLTLAKYWTKE